MNPSFVSSKQILILLILCMSAALMPACSRQSQPPRVEEITFQSGTFKIVGDLRLPEGAPPFPVVLFVHGGGQAGRLGNGMYLPIMERMLDAGYATFAWDKPGTGESTGSLGDSTVHSQRAKILLDAIQVMKARRDIDKRQIGLWGVSQAGYVMPRALAQSKDIAFMICVSCAGVSSVDQMAFQVTALALCAQKTEEQAAEEARLWAELDGARSFETYEEYLRYRRTLKPLAGLVDAPIQDWPALSERAWQKNPLNPQSLWNPIEVIEQSRIPILAIYGDRDRQLDPLQGAYAYRKALEQAGNPKSHVEVFPNANHAIAVSESGCPEEDDQRINQWLEQTIKARGFASLSEAQEFFMKDPYQSGLLSDFPFAPGYLDMMEEWLRVIHR